MKAVANPAKTIKQKNGGKKNKTKELGSDAPLHSVLFYCRRFLRLL
jgi:hypothetical protein